MTREGYHHRDYVLQTPGWPDGFCPIHVGEEGRCSGHCMEKRMEFAEAARALAAEWPRWEQRRQAKRIARSTAA